MFWYFPGWNIFPQTQLWEHIGPMAVENSIKEEQRDRQESNELNGSFERSYFLEDFKREIEKMHEKSQKKVWTGQEDKLLLQLVEERKPWNEIAQMISNTNGKNCQRRYQRLQRIEEKWSKEIDEFIKEQFEKYRKQWKNIAKEISEVSHNSFNYSGSIVRDRYHNHIRDGIKRKEWTVEEDFFIFKSVMEKGTNWSAMVPQFDGKTELEIKNRYYGMLKPLSLKIQGNPFLESRRTRSRRTNSQS